MTTTKKPINQQTDNQPVQGPTPTQTNIKPNVSRLGGGYGGSQHEQYPGEHGYKDSGKQGKLDYDENIKPDDEHHEPNRDGYRDTTPTGERDTDNEKTE